MRPRTRSCRACRRERRLASSHRRPMCAVPRLPRRGSRTRRPRRRTGRGRCLQGEKVRQCEECRGPLQTSARVCLRLAGARMVRMVGHAVEIGALWPAEPVVWTAAPLLRERVPAGAVPALEQPRLVRRGGEPGRWDVAVGLAQHGTLRPSLRRPGYAVREVYPASNSSRSRAWTRHIIQNAPPPPTVTMAAYRGPGVLSGSSITNRIVPKNRPIPVSSVA